ncbi:phosphotransferase family protein [Neobacillus sp. Marseille-QA0830]
MTESIQKALEDYFETKLTGSKSVEIQDFFQPSSGWSDESFIFTVHWESPIGKQQKGFAIRKKTKGGLTLDFRSFYQQFQFLDLLSKHSDLPVPGVYWYEEDESVLGGPFYVMDQLPGKSYVPWSKEGQHFFKSAHEDGQVPVQFVQYLAKLHLLDYRAAGFTKAFVEPKGEYGFIDDKLKDLEDMYYRYQVSPDPVMVDALGWLKANKPAAQRYSLIHNDYRTGNLLYDQYDITGILDWEAAEIGDPLADVAYVCAKSNRMDSPLMCYLLDRSMFLETYSELTGLKMDEKVLHYYEVFHQVRFVLISQSAGTSFAKGETTDLRMARQGYRWPLMRGMVAELLGY